MVAIDLKRVGKLEEIAQRLGVMKRTLHKRQQKRNVPKKYIKALIEVIKERQKELDEFILLLENK